MTLRHAYHDSPEIWKDLLLAGLKEDGWPWDWTSEGSIKNPTQKIGAKIVAKSDGIWVGEGLLEAVHRLAPELRLESELKNGDEFKIARVVCQLRGPARTLLAFERPFLNLASYVGGIATQTRTLVNIAGKVSSRPPRVCATRKILPLYRDLAILGVLSGGGFSHRVSLSGGVLIKENHIASAGGIAKAVQGARLVSPHLLKIEIEVRNEAELREALQAGVDGVLLDNFTVDQARSAVAIAGKTNPRPFIEISGGVNSTNISSYAIEGVDVISVGSLTHSVRATDLSLLVDA